jgi:uncharacterized protein
VKTKTAKPTLRIKPALSFGLRLRGLMLKTQWPRDYDGLWFPQCASVHTFFTFLKPDLIFLDKSYRVAAVHTEASAWRLCFGPKGTFGCLEIRGGEVLKRGWSVGTDLKKYFDP